MIAKVGQKLNFHDLVTRIIYIDCEEVYYVYNL